MEKDKTRTYGQVNCWTDGSTFLVSSNLEGAYLRFCVFQTHGKVFEELKDICEFIFKKKNVREQWLSLCHKWALELEYAFLNIYAWGTSQC